MKNQLGATYYFIVLLIGATCFGHYYAHHQEFATMMLITTLVVSFCKDGRVNFNVKLWFLVMGWAWHVARMAEERGVYRVLVGKLAGKSPLGRPTRRWVDNIRLDLQEVGCGYMDWIGLAQDRDRWRTLVSAVMNLPVP